MGGEEPSIVLADSAVFVVVFLPAGHYLTDHSTLFWLCIFAFSGGMHARCMGK